MQCIDADYTVTNPVRIGRSLTNFQQRQAVIRLFGVNEMGNSVLVYVHNFMPYFYVPRYPGMTELDMSAFAESLNVR